MTVSIWQADGTQPTREVDFLVIGAGIIGCAVAYFASQAGRKVTITEMRDVALGASSRNAGFLITGLDEYYHHGKARWGDKSAKELWDITRRSLNMWRDFAKRGGDVQIENTGSLLLSETPEEAKDLEAAARAMEGDGLPVEYFSTDPLRRGYHNAIRQPEDGVVHPYQLAQSVLKQSGAELIDNNEVYSIKQEGSVVKVHTRQFVLNARQVMICTNAYSPYLHPYFVGKVIPVRAQCLVTEPIKEKILPSCCYSDYGYMYYRQTFDGRLLIGGARNLHRELEHDTTDDRITDPVQRSLENYLRNRFPDVAASIDRRWAGIMGFSVDGLPMVGTLPEMNNVGFAVGFTGHGLSTGAVVAERAVEMMISGASPGIVDAARLR
ncbi:MAG TPA: FAD-dependent oxidoreductase [Steroidobacteraceae bacterium]|nr:FAD-dependent oxidoreductase [Steroidobacteraceae bacterium]